MADIADTATVEPETELPVFRSSKRRKIYRKRETSVSPVPTASANLPSIAFQQPAPEAASVPDIELSVSDILRQRKLLQRKKGGGIEFSASKSGQDGTTGESFELQSRGDASTVPDPEVKQIASRFAPQTGQVKEVMDRHM